MSSHAHTHKHRQCCWILWAIKTTLSFTIHLACSFIYIPNLNYTNFHTKNSILPKQLSFMFRIYPLTYTYTLFSSIVCEFIYYIQSSTQSTFLLYFALILFSILPAWVIRSQFIIIICVHKNRETTLMRFLVAWWKN